MANVKEIELTPLYYKYILGSDYRVVIQVGGRFSAKSYNTEIENIANTGSKANYKLLVIEDLQKGMSSGYYAGLVNKIEKFEHEKAYSCTKSPVHITNKINKNEILFSGYKSEQQKKSVKAMDQITEIVVEEGEWLEYSDFVALMHQLRGGEEKNRKLNILMNPVNEYCFVNETFIEAAPTRVLEYFPGTNRPKVFEKDIVTNFDYLGETIIDVTTVLIVISTHLDNPYLSIQQRASIENLKITDPDLYLQLGEARFIKSSGAYFKEFKREIHVIEPFVIPRQWRKYFVMDYGLDMLAGYWVAVNDTGKAFFYKEIYESDLIISKAAKRIKEITNEDIYQYLAPPDLWNRRQETGKSAMEIFSDNGIRLDKANNNRVDGWLALKEWLDPYEDEQGIMTANIQVFSNCTNLIRCISQVKRDERNPNDVASEPHELTHAPDAVRYFVAGRPYAYRPKMRRPIDNINRFVTKKINKGGYQTW